MTTQPTTSPGKLPIPIQLTGVTAVVFFCLSVIDVFNLSHVLWINQEMIASLDTGNLVQLGTPLALALVSCLASLFVFVTLVFRPGLRAARLAVCYLVFALALIVLRLVSLVLIQFVHPLPGSMLVVGVGLRLFYCGWCIGLLIKVWPHYMASRSGER